MGEGSRGNGTGKGPVARGNVAALRICRKAHVAGAQQAAFAASELGGAGRGLRLSPGMAVRSQEGGIDLCGQGACEERG